MSKPVEELLAMRPQIHLMLIDFAANAVSVDSMRRFARRYADACKAAGTGSVRFRPTAVPTAPEPEEHVYTLSPGDGFISLFRDGKHVRDFDTSDFETARIEVAGKLLSDADNEVAARALAYRYAEEHLTLRAQTLRASELRRWVDTMTARPGAALRAVSP